MFILTEQTPDPAQLRFVPGRPVLGNRTLEIRDREAAAVSPLAARLFEIEDVSALVLGPDHITVTKRGGDWQHLKPALLGAIMDHFVSGAPMLRDPAETAAGSPGQQAPPTITDKIREALRQVIDPELGYNIVDLGLIYDIAIQDGSVLVTMTTTTPGCPATTYLTEGARACAASVEGVGTAEVQLTHEPRWSTELMSDAAKAHFGIRPGGAR